jgi:phosphopantetheinyl transferase
MPIFFQQQINDDTRLGIWRIEEPESFFENNVPIFSQVSHPHKRLQRFAGRFLLPYLYPDFPYRLIQIADTKKPFLANEAFHFSISHCGDYAAAIVSKSARVGIDIEIPTTKIEKVASKFLHADEQQNLVTGDLKKLTVLWSAKESVFKWYGDGNVDFSEHIRLQQVDVVKKIIDCSFTKANIDLDINYKIFDDIVLTWVVN